MKRAPVHASAAGSADDHREAYALAVATGGGVVGENVKAARDEIDKLHLGNGPHAHHRRSARRADYRRFRDRRIDDSSFAKTARKAFGNFEGSAVDAYIFPKKKDALVAFHFFPESLTYCFE